jgi:hypothetical protein
MEEGVDRVCTALVSKNFLQDDKQSVAKAMIVRGRYLFLNIVKCFKIRV